MPQTDNVTIRLKNVTRNIFAASSLSIHFVCDFSHSFIGQASYQNEEVRSIFVVFYVLIVYSVITHKNTMETISNTFSGMKKDIGVAKHVALGSAVLALAFLVSCKSYFLAADFDTRTANHKTIAVLPFEMIFTGVKPEKLTNEDMRIIAEGESKAFMISFYNEILRSTRGGKKPIRVDVQHFDKTLSILKTNNIDIHSSWKEDPGKLAKMLGVDAVVKTRIEKHRLMSDLASYGIDLGTRILGILSDYRIWLWLPPNLAKSKEVKSSCSLMDKEGVSLWSIAYDIDADWRSPTNEIIDDINRKSAKRFPYRIKK